MILLMGNTDLNSFEGSQLEVHLNVFGLVDYGSFVLDKEYSFPGRKKKATCYAVMNWTNNDPDFKQENAVDQLVNEPVLRVGHHGHVRHATEAPDVSAKNLFFQNT